MIFLQLCIHSTQFKDVLMVLGLSSYYSYQRFSTFSTSFFPDPIGIRIDILWAQLLREFSTYYFEAMHNSSE